MTDLLAFIESRRSVRMFDRSRPVAPAHVLRCIRAARAAPAPHHTRPWRFCVVDTPQARRALAESMGTAWRTDLEADAVPAARIERLLARSRHQIVSAPALVLLSVVYDGSRDWPDPLRAGRERTLFAHSAGAAMQNLFLAAHALGLASFWISAPLYAPDAARISLDLPTGWDPAALAVLGYPDPSYRPRPRPVETDVEVR